MHYDIEKYDNSTLMVDNPSEMPDPSDIKSINEPIIKKLEADLRRACSSLLNSEIFIHESFVNVYHGKSEIVKHNHVIKTDEDLAISAQKFSLVYYLRVGDQNAAQPGILKLYDPIENILPYKGMVIIFPSDRLHSVIYNGNKDRIMIGINFYAL